MGHLGKVVLGLAVVAGAVGGGAILACAAGTPRSGHRPYKPGIVGVTNAGRIGLFAARTAPGPHVIVFDAGMDPEGRPIDALLRALQPPRRRHQSLHHARSLRSHRGRACWGGRGCTLGSGDLGLASGQVRPRPCSRGCSRRPCRPRR